MTGGPALPEVGVATVAKICNVDERRIQQLTKQGVLPKVRHGRYDLLRTVSSYIQYLQNQGTGAETKDAHTEKTRLLSAQADKAEIEAARLRGEVVEIADVEKGWQEIAAVVRQNLLTIPDKAAPAVAIETNLAKCKEILKQAVYDTLDDISETEPVTGAERGRKSAGRKVAVSTKVRKTA